MLPTIPCPEDELISYGSFSEAPLKFHVPDFHVQHVPEFHVPDFHVQHVLDLF